MSSSETFEFFDERVALLFVGFTVWNTNGDCAAVIEPRIKLSAVYTIQPGPD